MNLGRIPLVGWILASGPDDRVFDALLLIGPVIIALIALLGRSLVVEAIVVVFLVAIVGHVLTNWLGA